MKYSTEIEINKPVDQVVALFDNPANLTKWMAGLQQFEHLSGAPGQPGATSRLIFQMGKRRIEMTETITVRNLPDEFSGTYEAKGVFNRVTNRFVRTGEDRTRYITENEFQFTGLMRIIGWLMPGAFRKQTLKTMNDFKAFAENTNQNG